MATNAADLRSRHRLAREAVLAVAPELANGDPEAITPQAVGTLSMAIDLFQMQSRWRAVFYEEGDVRHCWRLSSDESWVEFDRGEVAFNSEPGPMCLTIAIAPSYELSRLDTPRLRVGAANDLIDRTLWAVLRLMLIGASVVLDRDVSRLTAEIIEQLRAWEVQLADLE